MSEATPFGIYLHIPYCKAKCRYCDFLSAPLAADSSTADGYVPEAYVDALLSQIVQESQFYQERRVTTIFWGGGTPSLLRVMDMERLMDAIRTHFCVADDAEITLESNPGTLDFEKLAGYRRAGINRLSMGLQSACDKELAMLGRIHNFDTFVQNYKQARRAGFENINVDLMSALPGQTVESWEQTLMKAAEFAPEHLSAYSLIIEEGTPFWNWYGEDANQTLRPKEMLPLPSEEDERRMYARTREILEQYGYHRYEISNYAKDGYACRHNIGYWTGVEYLGLGLGASSLVGGKRFQVTADLNRYLVFTKEELAARAQYEEIHELSRQERMEEFMFLGLRLTGGVRTAEFERRFGVAMEAVYGEVIERLLKEGLLEASVQTDSHIRLTEYGLDVSTYALAEFLQ